MAEFTTMEIAFRTRKSERQVQRWIKSGKLKAQHIDGPLYEVNEDDLTPFLPREVVNDLVERIALLEARITQLEGIIEGLSSNTPRPQKRPQRLIQPQNEASASNIFPDGYMALNDLLKQHNLMSKRNAIIAYLEKQGKLKRGNWTLSGHAVNLALDEQGIAEFWKRYVR